MMNSSRKNTGGPQNKKRKHRKLRLALMGIGSVLGALLLGLFVYTVVAIAQTPSWHPDELYNQKEASVVLDKDGKQIAQLHAGENRIVATSDEIPKLVKEAFVAVEDKRFYSHIGIDPIRILGALVTDLRHHSMDEGGSTITQQLARNAFIENPTDKTLSRKIQEAVIALQLEREYTKDEILTFYLNTIPFGQQSFGIKAAAQTYFGKDLKDLTPGEIALLAGLPQANTSYNPYLHPDAAKTRRNIVLGVMKDSNLISAADYNKYKEAGFPYVEQQLAQGSAGKTTKASTSYQFPYFVDAVIDELENTYGLTENQVFNGGLTIKTSVDPKIQAEAEKAFADSSNFPSDINGVQVQGAMTMLDQSTGEIVALVGGREYTPRGLNRATSSARQPGSSIKPLVVYAPALEKGGYFPGTVLDDMPVSYDAGDGSVYAPVDDDTATSGWKGLITMREALRNSVNVYAVRLLDKIGVDYGWDYGKNKMGLPLKDTDKNLTLALGTADVSTLNMASAYSAFPNDGVRVTPHTVTEVDDASGKVILQAKVESARVMKETTAFLINDMLRTVVTSGTGTSAQIGNWAVCGKTGTTSLDPKTYGDIPGNKDAWFAGYTPKYTGVVWMGFDSDDSTHQYYLRQIYGGSYPAKIWKQVMTTALDGLEVQTSYPQPPGIVSGTYDTKSGLLPSSLTPQQFIGTEIAAQGDFPTKVSDVWGEKEIDANHPDYLAGPTTKRKMQKLCLIVPDRDGLTTPWPYDEAPYQPPAQTAPAAPATAPVTGTQARNDVSPPAGDESLPALTLDNLVYDAPSKMVTIHFTSPPGSENYGLVVYIKRPGENNLDTYYPYGLMGNSATVVVPLGGKKKSGDYSFWIASVDPDSRSAGPPSEVFKLSITP